MSSGELRRAAYRDYKARIYMDAQCANGLCTMRAGLNLVKWCCAGRQLGALLHSAWVKYGEGYTGPSYNRLRGKLLQNAVVRLNADLVLYWEEAEYTGITLMSDGWTDTSHRPLMNVLAATPKGSCFLFAENVRASTRMHSSLPMCGARAWSV